MGACGSKNSNAEQSKLAQPEPVKKPTLLSGTSMRDDKPLMAEVQPERVPGTPTQVVTPDKSQQILDAPEANQEGAHYPEAEAALVVTPNAQQILDASEEKPTDAQCPGAEAMACEESAAVHDSSGAGSPAPMTPCRLPNVRSEALASPPFEDSPKVQVGHGASPLTNRSPEVASPNLAAVSPAAAAMIAMSSGYPDQVEVIERRQKQGSCC